MDDYISRQAAIGCLRSGQICGDFCRKAINELPTATPKIRTGYWIRHENADIVDGYYVPEFECSECHGFKKDDSDFCPDCGAKMDAQGEE